MVSAEVERVLEAISAQQPKVQDCVWGVGEQLKDMVLREPELAPILEADLKEKAMSLAACEKKLRALAACALGALALLTRRRTA